MKRHTVKSVLELTGDLNHDGLSQLEGQQASDPMAPKTGVEGHIGICLSCALRCSAGGGYLANVAPSEFACVYEPELPEAITGAAFLAEYGDHWDKATQASTGNNPMAARFWSPLCSLLRVAVPPKCFTAGS